MMLGFTQAAFMPAALSILSVASHPPPSVAISALTTGSATGRSGGLLLGGGLLLMATQLHVADLEPWRLARLALVAPNPLDRTSGLEGKGGEGSVDIGGV